MGGGAQGVVVDVTEREVGTSEAGAVYVREGLRGNAEGEAVWWAGRRRRVMRTRDVRVVQRHQMSYVEMVSVTQGNLRICRRIRSAFSRTGAEVTGGRGARGRSVRWTEGSWRMQWWMRGRGEVCMWWDRDGTRGR